MEIKELSDGSLWVSNPSANYKILSKELYGDVRKKITMAEYNLMKLYIEGFSV